MATHVGTVLSAVVGAAPSGPGEVGDRRGRAAPGRPRRLRPGCRDSRAGRLDPLCNVLHETFPAAEIMLLGVEEPRCGIHAPNESVDPSEIENMALVEARFLERYVRGLPA